MGFPGKILGSVVSSVVKSRPRDKTTSEWHTLLQRAMQIKSAGLARSGKFRGASALNRLITCASVGGGISCVQSTVREIFVEDRLPRRLRFLALLHSTRVSISGFRNASFLSGANVSKFVLCFARYRKIGASSIEKKHAA